MRDGDAGRSIRDRVEQVWRTLEEEIFEGFSVEERNTLRRLFLQMRENLKRVVGGKPPCEMIKHVKTESISR